GPERVAAARPMETCPVDVACFDHGVGVLIVEVADVVGARLSRKRPRDGAHHAGGCGSRGGSQQGPSGTLGSGLVGHGTNLCDGWLVAVLGTALIGLRV